MGRSPLSGLLVERESLRSRFRKASGCTGIAVDDAGNLYVASASPNVVKISNGVVSTVAGNGTHGFGGDNGPATSAELGEPINVAVDSAGNLYIADTQNNRIRKVTNGVITTIAGNGTPGFSGNNGPAIGAELSSPEGVAVDSTGNLYIPDSVNNRIRKVNNGVIATIAGTGLAGSSGDGGPPTGAQLNFAQGVAVDSARNVYIADAGSSRVYKVSNGVITTVAREIILTDVNAVVVCRSTRRAILFRESASSDAGRSCLHASSVYAPMHSLMKASNSAP